MPSDESEVIDLTKMQGPPDKDTAAALKKEKSWGKILSEKQASRKTQRDQYSSVAAKRTKNAGNYNASMKKYDKSVKQMDEEDSQSSGDSVRAWEKQLENPSPELRRALKGISYAYKKGTANTKPLRKAGGGLIRGAGNARGVKPYKVC